MYRIFSAAFVMMAGLAPAYAGGITLGKEPEAERRAAAGEKQFGRFSDADTSRDFSISKDEWTSFVSTQSGKVPDFNEIDANKNGEITPDEWKAYADAHPEEQGASTGAGDGTEGQQQQNNQKNNQ